MAIETLGLLTGNPDKIRAARKVFTDFDIDINPLKSEMPEIQPDSGTSAEVARFAVRAAFERYGSPVLREDHSFYIDELGIPGPYMAFMGKKVSVSQLISIVDILPSRRAHFEIAAAYIDRTGDLFESSFTVPLQIAKEPKGDTSLNWERAMILEGDTSTFAEIPADSRDYLWTQNYLAVAKHIVGSAA